MASNDDVADALYDSAWLAGVQAGFRAAQSDDPNTALAALRASRAGYLTPIRDRQRRRIESGPVCNTSDPEAAMRKMEG